jgi:beta-glucosidase
MVKTNKKQDYRLKTPLTPIDLLTFEPHRPILIEIQRSCPKPGESMQFMLSMPYKRLFVSLITFLAPTTSQAVCELLTYQTAVAAAACVGVAKLEYDNYTAHSINLAWDWNAIKKSKAYPVQGHQFPKGFAWGTATSAYQIESNCKNSSYEGWTKSTGYKEPAGIACEGEKRYKEDIALMAKELHLNIYRFSLERSNVEPEQGTFDKKVLGYYADLCTELIKNNIRPLIGFQHYSDPRWWLEKGGFADAKNVACFVTYCTTVFEALQPVCLEAIKRYHGDSQEALEKFMPWYLTFNSPSSYALQGYYNGNRPPGTRNMQVALEVMKNMLEAHVRVYKECKKLPGAQHCKIGTTHNIYHLDPDYWLNPIARVNCFIGNHLANTAVMNFFATGTLSIRIPLMESIYYTNPDAPKCLDFIGLNCYGRAIVSATGEPTPLSTEIPTDNPRYTVCAEAMYRAIVDMSTRLAKPLNIPIIVTENGIATNDDSLRQEFFERYVYAIHKAIQEGHRVEGYTPWSLLDNYEWGDYAKLYGFYLVDRTLGADGKPKLTRTLKPGARYFVELVAQHRAAYA